MRQQRHLIRLSKDIFTDPKIMLNLTVSAYTLIAQVEKLAFKRPRINTLNMIYKISADMIYLISYQQYKQMYRFAWMFVMLELIVLQFYIFIHNKNAI